MRLAWALLLAAACSSGGDFQVPPAPDAHVELDLAVSPPAPPDMTCFNLACGACSSWANWDGTPTKPGDPCLFNGVWQCSGSVLTCTSTACLPCASPVSGTVCGADGHSIVELLTQMGTCSAYDFGSTIGVCNHNAADKCQQRCLAAGGGYVCTAHCLSDDGGGTGHDYSPTATCTSLP